MRNDNVSDVPSRLLRHHRAGAPRSRHLRGRYARSELNFLDMPRTYHRFIRRYIVSLTVKA
jgi:hypothetical protein